MIVIVHRHFRDERLDIQKKPGCKNEALVVDVDATFVVDQRGHGFQELTVSCQYCNLLMCTLVRGHCVVELQGNGFKKLMEVQILNGHKQQYK